MTLSSQDNTNLIKGCNFLLARGLGTEFGQWKIKINKSKTNLKGVDCAIIISHMNFSKSYDFISRRTVFPKCVQQEDSEAAIQFRLI